MGSVRTDSYRTEEVRARELEGLERHSVVAWRGGTAERSDSRVVVEEPLAVCVEGRVVAVLMRTPGMDKELAVGYCLGEGIIPSVSMVGTVQHCGQADPGVPDDASPEARNRVEIRLLDPSSVSIPDEPARLIRSGCGRADLSGLLVAIERLGEGFIIDEATLRGAVRGLNRSQERYRAAGGVHAAGVFGPDGAVAIVCEDIGRHNAVDKALGYCALRGISTSDKFVVSTGRASYEFVTKSARFRVPVVASMSSPTSLAVELAERLGLTLVGYLRADRFMVYTRPERIRLSNEG